MSLLMDIFYGPVLFLLSLAAGVLALWLVAALLFWKQLEEDVFCR